MENWQLGAKNVISNRGRKLGEEATVIFSRGPTRGPNPEFCTTSILDQYGIKISQYLVVVVERGSKSNTIRNPLASARENKISRSSH